MRTIPHWVGCLFLVSLCACATSAFAGQDFNADGKDDVLWRQANGQPVLWLMNGLAQPVAQVLPSAPGNTWAIAGTGDFLGNGSREIFWLSSQSSLSLWYISNGQLAYYNSIVNAPLASGSSFIGVGDVDGDSKSDILWLGPDGNASVWLMGGSSVTSTIALGAAPASAMAIAVADFDGDGKADLLWRNSAGQYTLWLLNGTGLRSAAPLNPAPTASWVLAKAADFNGDGKADLLWRLPDGSLSISWMNGASHADTAIGVANPDPIFANGFDDTTIITPVSSLPAPWQVVDVGDYDGDGHPDILFADNRGYTQIWRMSGASVLAAAQFPPALGMPYAGTTGWVLPVDRPSVTQVNAQVSVTWPPVAGVSGYVLYSSASNNPSLTGLPATMTGNTSTYSRNDPVYAAARYFSVSTSIYGLPTPPSPEAYLLEFTQVNLGYTGPMAIADINGDGCIDIIGALSNCLGGFTVVSEADMGLGALRANGRRWRDLRIADFNGDGIDDIIANVYSCDVVSLPNCSQNDTNSRIQLYWGDGNATFTQDMAFDAMNIPGGGFGETIVVADFDNDGSLDVFLPKYTAYDGSEHNFLLMNDGQGNFTDMADSAGVAMRNTSLYFRPEGAQAADLDGDGRIDLYAGSHLFMNRTLQPGQPVFADQRIDRGLPLQFDEGAKFVDWNNDGNLDLALLDTQGGPQIWQNNGSSFSRVNVVPNVGYNTVNGLTGVDLDGDGRPDLVIAGGCKPGYSPCNGVLGELHQKPTLLLNRGTAYVRSDFYDDGLADNQRYWNDLQTFADFDNNGTLDVASRYAGGDADTNPQSSGGGISILLNRASSTRAIHVTVLGAAGERSQYGRVVRVSPLAKPGFVMTDVVDGGSGYMANGPYSLQFAAPYMGAYRVDVDLADCMVEVMAVAGQSLTIYADGVVSGAATPATVTKRLRVQ